MKDFIRRKFNSFADSLVLLSKLHGRPLWWVFLLIFTLTIVLSVSSASNAYNGDRLKISSTKQICSQKSVDGELRGVWLTNIDSDVLFSPHKTASAIDLLDRAHFNTLYPTVWNWGHTLYPSAVAQKAIGQSLDPEPGLQGRDVLQEIIDEGHRRGMAVIPWFEFGFMAPADSQLAMRHPDWLTKRSDGTTVWWEGNVHQRVWLNALHPEVQQLMTDLLVELVDNYEIEGIQVDDHFGFPSEFGYDEFTIELYQQEHGGKLPPEDSQDPDWIRWRADKITNYVNSLFAAVKQRDPQVIFAVSPNPQDFSLNSFLLDWHKWERMGLIEELVVQVYRSDLDSFIGEIEQPEMQAARENIPVGVGVLSGLKGRPVAFDLIQEQVKAARDRNFAGVSFFFYESLWNLADELPSQRRLAFKTLFQQEAKRPILNNCSTTS